MGCKRFSHIIPCWTILLGFVISASSRQIAQPLPEKVPKQFEQGGGGPGGFQGGGNQGGFQGVPGGFPQPGAGQSQEVVDEEEEDSSPGPGALGVLTGLWGVFNGIGSLLNGGSPNKILESSVNFFPPHERDKAQVEVNKLLGKTTKKPEIIYVTVTIPAPAPAPTAAAIRTQPPPVAPATPVAATQAVAVTAATVAAAPVPAAAAAQPVVVTTTLDPDDSEEDENEDIVKE